ncbi:MAG: DNA polymerase IV, partial [Tissierellia bacterium]|nr:DNA polymerase IV [Tissierellia bacterium]
RNVFQELAFEVSEKLRKYSFKATGVQITVRDSNLESRQYQCQIPMATQSSIILTEQAMELFNLRYQWHLPIRSLTIRAIGLVSVKENIQLDLFSDYKDILKKENLDTAMYELRQRFGKKMVTFASQLGDIKMPKDMTDIVTLPNGLTR